VYNMTQIQAISAKEMTRRTGCRNALGYSYPKKDLILLRKDLKGKKKREVLDHEINHLSRGEEGPFLGTALSMAGPVLGALGGVMGGDAASDEIRRYGGYANQQYAPYSQFGQDQLGSLTNWLSSPEGAWGKPTMESVMSTPGYETRLGAIENSAAARGGLLSGNALRDIGEFGASEYDRAIDRRSQELQQRLGMVTGVGLPAAGGRAGIYQNMMGPQAGFAQARGNALSDLGGTVAGFGGQLGGFMGGG